MAVIVPKKAENEEIDEAEGKNKKYQAIQNFYEYLKKFQGKAFKELEDLIEKKKSTVSSKMDKTAKRRAELKTRLSKKKDAGEWKEKEEYQKDCETNKVLREETEKLAELAKQARQEEEKLAVEAKKAAKKDNQNGEEKAPKNFDRKAGNKNKKKDLKKTKFPVEGDASGKKREFNNKAKEFNKNVASAAPPRPAVPLNKKQMIDEAVKMHPSWQAKRELANQEIDIKTKNQVMEL